MALEPTIKIVLGSIAFGIFWVLAVFPAVPLLPIGRTAGSLLGGMLMVIFRVITPNEAYSAIDLPILGLLFGTMVVSVFLERADMFKYLGKLLSWKCKGGKDLICRISIISAVSSALFTNDTCCVVLTEFVLKIARQNNLSPKPFLIALASSANIGSSMTPIGNPQNLVIAVQSGISFGQFLLGILPAMLVGIFVNIIILLSYYWDLLAMEEGKELTVSEAVELLAEDGGVASHRFSPATMSHPTSSSSNTDYLHKDRPPWNRESGLENGLQVLAGSGNESTRVSSDLKEATTGNQGEAGGACIMTRRYVRNSNSMDTLTPTPIVGVSYLPFGLCEKEDSIERWKNVLWKACVYLVTLGMLFSLLLGLDMSWTALTAALALIVLDFKDARPCLEKVSYSLLIFFCGMFITVDGFNKTGIPSAMWDYVEPYAQVNSAEGIAMLALVILFLSNVASNVPTVLLLGARVAASAAEISPAEETKAWLILAWVSTVAGNFSLLGSAANLIVCEQARRTQSFGYNLSFFSHLRFGVPSTLIITAIGLLLIAR